MRSAAAEEAEEVTLPVTHLDGGSHGKLGAEKKQKTKLKRMENKENDDGRRKLKWGKEASGGTDGKGKATEKKFRSQNTLKLH